jgi:hypothetical protein
MGREGEDLPYRIEQWDERGGREELIALAGDLFVARRAYEEAVRRRGGKRITLSNRALLIQRSYS